jgi:AraC-like DNA-binding protein
MHEVILTVNSLPLIREVGHMSDEEGLLKHPDRLMETINVFVYVKKGLIDVIEDGIKYELSEGSYLFLRKNTPHWGSSFYIPGTEWYYIHFYNLEEKETPEFSHYQHSSLILEENYSAHIKLPKQGMVHNPEYIEWQLKKLHDDYQSPQPFRPLYLSALTYQFFVDLYTVQLTEGKESKQHRIVGRMIELFSQAAPKKLSSEEISTTLGMNYAYLSTLFRQETGKSITQFQDELLIEKAITLLKKESVNISEVSDTLGFSNPFYFSRVFKKITGVSPSAYLKQTYRT